MASIKIKTSTDEYNDISYFRNFEIVYELPKVGDTYHSETVVSIEQMRKDPEQPTNEADEMDCFHILTKSNPEDDETWDYWIAISRVERNHMETVVKFDTVPPTIDQANALIMANLNGSQLKEDTYALEEEIEENGFIQTYFGISPDLYENVVIAGASPDPTAVSIRPFQKNNLPAECEEAMIIGTPYGVEIRAKVPYWWDECILIGKDEIKAAITDGILSPRTEADLHPAIFNEIVMSCAEQGSYWREFEGYPGWFHLISLNEDEIFLISQRITDVCCLPFKELLKAARYTQARFSKDFNIPIRTVEDWCSERRECKIYLRLLLGEKMGLIRPHRLSKSS